MGSSVYCIVFCVLQRAVLWKPPFELFPVDMVNKIDFKTLFKVEISDQIDLHNLRARIPRELSAQANKRGYLTWVRAHWWMDGRC